MFISHHFLSTNQRTGDPRWSASNSNYRVIINEHDLFVKLGEKANEEYQNGMIASELGLSPKIHYYHPEMNLVVLPFIQGETKKLDWNSPEMIEQIVSKVRYLHASGAQFEKTFTPFETIDIHYEEIKERLDVPLVLKEKILPAVKQIQNKLGDWAVSTPCHLDLHMGNFMYEEDQLWMIDWEFAAMSDPFFDLAVFCSTENLTADQSERVLKEYLQQVPLQEEKESFAEKIFLADVRWLLWSYYQQVYSDIDWDYELDASIFLKRSLDWL